jgi:acyl-CoA synthetase (NDP forming)
MHKTQRLEAIHHIFHPENIAILGASKNIMKWGTIIPANIISGGYQGTIYPISLTQPQVLGLKAYSSIFDLPEPPDMVFICLPAEKTPELLHICGQAKANTLVIIAGGFSEVGEEGAQLEEQLKSAAKRYPQMAIVGPNTMGVANPHMSLYALMPTVTPDKGNIAFVSQSGNLGTQMMAFGMRQQVGFSKFVSSGNELVLRTEDFIEYFGEDPETAVILCYIEGIRDTKRFTQVAKQVSLKKPIIVYKAGKYESGRRAAQSHTGAISGSYELYQTLFNQSGIIEAQKTVDMIDYAKAFSRLPPLKGDRIGIISWGGGWGVITTDEVTKAGLKVPSLPAEIVAKIDKYLPPFWSKNNPIDLVGTLSRRAHSKSFEALYESGMDGIIALGIIVGKAFTADKYADFLDASHEEIKVFQEEFEQSDVKFLRKMKRLMKTHQKPIIIVSLMHSEEILKEDVVIYSMPEQAAQVMKKLHEYYQFRVKVDKSKNKA